MAGENNNTLLLVGGAGLLFYLYSSGFFSSVAAAAPAPLDTSYPPTYPPGTTATPYNQYPPGYEPPYYGNPYPPQRRVNAHGAPPQLTGAQWSAMTPAQQAKYTNKVQKWEYQYGDIRQVWGQNNMPYSAPIPPVPTAPVPPLGLTAAQLAKWNTRHPASTNV